MTQYYFVRHGESTANAAGILAGWRDYSLNERGVEQATETAHNIKATDIRFDAILSSPLPRALQTAQIIADINGYPDGIVQVVDELKGGSGGDLDGLPYKHWYETPEEEIASTHGGEDAEILRARVGRAIVKITELTANLETALLVSHAGIYQMIQAIHDGLEPATEAYNVAKTKNGEFIEINL